MIPLFIINFLLAISTTIGMSITPLLVTESLGISMFVFGLIEGGSEFISNILKLASGNIYDRIKAKKNIFILSTSLACISRLLLMLPSVLTVFSAKIVERLSNGLFAAPRDAFVGQNTKNKGFTLGLLNCSKTLGCIIGPFIVSATVFFLGDLQSQLTKVLGICLILTLIAIILSFFIGSTQLSQNLSLRPFSFKHAKNTVQQLVPLYTIALLFFLARFNDGVIMLYLKKSGFPEWFYLSTVGFFNLVMFIASPILGFIIDKGKTQLAFYITILSLVIFNVSFYFLSLAPILLTGIGLISWGLQRVGAQLSFTSIIFFAISEQYYGTAIGIYALVNGIGTLIASVICGHLAQHSFTQVFIFSGLVSFMCFVCAVILLPKLFSRI